MKYIRQRVNLSLEKKHDIQVISNENMYEVEFDILYYQLFQNQYFGENEEFIL